MEPSAHTCVTPDSAFSALLSERLRSLGWTRAMFRARLAACGLRVTRQAVDAWVRGVSVPTGERLLAVCAILGIAGTPEEVRWLRAALGVSVAPEPRRNA